MFVRIEIFLDEGLHLDGLGHGISAFSTSWDDKDVVFVLIW